MLALKYLTKNKKRTFITVLSVVLSSILLFCIGLLFSSVREYLLDEVKINNGSYHVKIKTANYNIDSNQFKVVKEDGNLLITYDNVYDVYKLTDELCSKIKCEKTEYNNSLLSLYGISKQENMVQMFTALLIVFISILSIGIAIIVYNAFSISVMERKKQFGILKSIGMTQKKIKNMVMFESLVILIIGIVVGFSLSLGIMTGVLEVLNNLLEELFVTKLTLAFYPLFIIIPVIFIMLIVLLSAYLPAVRASKFNVIENLKNKGDYKVKKKYIFDKKDVIFRLAYHNYKRNKKRYRPVIFCLFISVILFVSFSLYLNYGVNSLNDYSRIPDYDLEVHAADKSTLEQFALDNNASKYSAFEHCLVPVTIDKKYYLAKAFKYYKENTNLLVVSGEEDKIVNRLKQIETNDDKMNKVDMPYLKDEIFLDINRQKYKFKTTDKIPFGISNLLNFDNIVMTTNHIDDYCPVKSSTLIMKGQIPNLKEKLETFSKKHEIELTYVDVYKATKLTQNIVTTIKIVLYGVLLLVVLIVISSITNIMMASMDLRTKEFGTLFSIGLTHGQWKNLVFYETMFIVIKSFLLTIPFIFMIDYVLYQSINGVFTSGLIIPFKEMVISLIFSILVIYFALYKAHSKMRKMAIITMLNSDNV